MSAGQLINLVHYQLLHKKLRSIISDIHEEDTVKNNKYMIPYYAHILDNSYDNIVDESYGYGREVPYVEKEILNDIIYGLEWNRIYYMLQKIYFHQDYHSDTYQSDLLYYTIFLVNEGDNVLRFNSEVFYGNITNVRLIEVTDESNNLITNPLFKTNEDWVVTGDWELDLKDSYARSSGNGELRYVLPETEEPTINKRFLLSFTLRITDSDIPADGVPPDSKLLIKFGSETNQYEIDGVGETGNEIPIHNYVDINKESIISYNDELNIDITESDSIANRLIDTRLSISDNYNDLIGIRKYIRDPDKTVIDSASRVEGWNGLLKHRINLFAVSFEDHLKYISEENPKSFEKDPHSDKDLMRYYFNAGGEIYIETDIAKKDISDFTDPTSDDFRDFIISNNLDRISITADSVYSYSSDTIGISSKDLFSDSSNRTLLTPPNIKRGFYIETHDSETYSTLDPNNPAPEFLDDEGIIDPGGGFGELLYSFEDTINTNTFSFKLYRKREFEEEYRKIVSDVGGYRNEIDNDRCIITVLLSAKDSGDEDLTIVYPITMTVSDALPVILGYTNSFEFDYIPPEFIEDEEGGGDEVVFSVPKASDGSIAFDKDDFRYNENCQIPPSFGEDTIIIGKEEHYESGGIVPFELDEYPIVVIHRDDTSDAIRLDESQAGDLEIGFSMGGDLDNFYEGEFQSGIIRFTGRYLDFEIDRVNVMFRKYDADGFVQTSFNETGIYSPYSVEVGEDPRLPETEVENETYFKMERANNDDDRVYVYTFIPEGLNSDKLHNGKFVEGEFVLRITVGATNIDTNEIDNVILEKIIKVKKVFGPTIDLFYRPDFSYTLKSQRTTQTSSSNNITSGIISKDTYIPNIVEGVSNTNKSVKKYEIDVYEDDILHFELLISSRDNNYKPVFYNINDVDSKDNEYFFIRPIYSNESNIDIQFEANSNKINEYLPYDDSNPYDNPEKYIFPYNVINATEGDIVNDELGYYNDLGVKKINFIYSEIDNSGELSRRRHLYIGGLRNKSSLKPGQSEVIKLSMKLSNDVKPYDTEGLDVQDLRGFHYDYIDHQPEIDFEFKLIKAIYSTYQDFGEDSLSLSSVNIEDNPDNIPSDQVTHTTLSNRVLSEMHGLYSFSDIDKFERIEILVDGTIRSSNANIPGLEIDVKTNSENNLSYDFNKSLNQFCSISVINYGIVSGSNGVGGKGQDKNGYSARGTDGGLTFYLPPQSSDIKRRYFLLDGGLRSKNHSLGGYIYVGGGGGGGGSATLKVEYIPVTSNHYTIDSSTGKVTYHT